MSGIKFGTDGWRGIIADDFTFSNVQIVAQAISDYLKDFTNSKIISIIIGYDNRFLSKEYAEIVAEILKSNEIEVTISQKPVPTPLVSWAVATNKYNFGVMISASHNPYFYNGIKLRGPQGQSLSLEETRKVENKLFLNPPQETKKDYLIKDLSLSYLNSIKEKIDFSVFKNRKIKIVVDYLYGSAAEMLESIFAHTDLEFITLHNFRDPLFGGINPEPIGINLDILKKTVIQNKADLGIALDGDGDRIGIIDNEGKEIPPHQVFPLLLLYLIENKNLRGKIVQTVSLGYLSQRIAHNFGLDFQEVGVGFKNVAKIMLTQDVLAGGEESGGYAFKNYLPDRDGIYNASIFMEMLIQQNKQLSYLLTAMQERYGYSVYQRIDLPIINNKFKKEEFFNYFSKLDKIDGKLIKDKNLLDGLKFYFDDGWVLLRISGTEPVLRIYVEMDEKNKVQEIIEEVKNICAQWF